MMKLLHALAAALTAFIFFIKQSYAFTTGMKLRNFSQLKCSENMVELSPSDTYASSSVWSECCTGPKYKRDPEIYIDNDDIGEEPRD